MKTTRSSGILLHPTSLPGEFGIGDLGYEAYIFADFLAASNQGYWQVLPLGPVGYGNSPYQCFSAFAGNTLMISPRKLIEYQLLSEADLTGAPQSAPEQIDFGAVIDYKNRILQKAFDNFQHGAGSNLTAEFQAFCRQEAFWLDDYTLFAALKDVHNGSAWSSWAQGLARREPAALAQAREELRDAIEAKKFFQYLFFKQWFELKEFCNQRQIRLIGDLPIFVAYDSADMWQQPDLFKTDAEGNLSAVAGVPPDVFSKTGQLWGNPLYNWEKMQADDFQWWVARLRAMMNLFDLIRVDHFRGFAACWEVPAGETTAINGKWVTVPGRELFQKLKETFTTLPVIAEDLGVITPDVVELREEFEFPGMRVLQFAFSSGSDNIHLPIHYTANSVVYTGTHDNDTTVGWFNSLKQPKEAEKAVEQEANEEANKPVTVSMSDNNEQTAATDAQVATEPPAATEPAENHELTYCLKFLNTNGEEIHWDLIRAAFASVANIAIVPMQDLMGLDTNARMNFPSKSDGNWSWRYQAEQLTRSLCERLRELALLYGRGPTGQIEE